MNTFHQWDGWTKWMPYLLPLAVFAGTAGLGFIVRRIALRRLELWAKGTSRRFDDLIVESLRTPVLVWVLMLAVYAATQSSPMTDRFARLTGTVLLALWILSLTLVASKLSGLAVREYGSRIEGARPLTGIGHTVLRIAVLTAGGLVLLNTLGVSITPVLTALGVGGLAVALALQDTLANFFAGVYITLAGQIRVGDYLKLDGGEEGHVSDISWRSTTIRMLTNNLIIVPNSKLGQAIVTNYSLPERRMAVTVTVGVSYESDIDEVERMLFEEAQRLANELPAMLDDPPPVVRLSPGFGESSLDFTVICQVQEFSDQFPVQHELRKRIFKRFKREGVDIPFPMRTLQVQRARPVTGNNFASRTS